jgi:hypothetical protein
MGRALPNHIRILVHRIREHSRRHVGPLIRLVRVGCAIFAGLFAIVMGGCGAEFGGGVGLVDFPPNVQMERWESIGPGSCKGWLTNNGSHTARDVRVSFRYRTARGDTALILVPTSTRIDPYAHIAVFAPPKSLTESCASQGWVTSPGRVAAHSYLETQPRSSTTSGSRAC